jgi:hypothetical protein
MKAMTDTTIPIWQEFEEQLKAKLKDINDTIKKVFDQIVRIVSSIATSAVISDRVIRSTVKTFLGNLLHRQDLTLADVKKTIKEFGPRLTEFHRDAFSPLKTAIIGTLMEGTYHKANLQSGKLCTPAPVMNHASLTNKYI